MSSQNSTISNQVVVMTRAELDSLVNEVAQTAASKSVSTSQKDAGNNNAEAERYVSRTEAAEILHVSTTTLWRWTKQGIVSKKRIGGRRILYKYSDIIRAIEEEKNGGAE